MNDDLMMQLLRDNADLVRRVARLESWETGDGMITIPIPNTFTGVQPFPQAAQYFGTNIPIRGGIGVNFKGLSISFYPNTNQSAVNFYTASVIAVAPGAVYTGLTITGTTNTKTFVTAGRWYEMPITITSGTLPTTNFQINLTLTPSGAPGTFYTSATLYYKKVG